MKADTSELFNELMDGKPAHRLCIDFNHPGNMKEFMEKARAAGLIPSECEPICIFAEGPTSVWLVAKRKERLVMEH